jgi:hypothetical protein
VLAPIIAVLNGGWGRHSQKSPLMMLSWWHFGHSILHEFLDRETTADAANKGSSQVEVNTAIFLLIMH